MRINPHLVLLVLFSALCLSSPAYAQQQVGKASIQAPAVILYNNTGSLTTITLTVFKGTGKTSINGPAIVAQSTVQSATTAAMYASQYLSLNYSDYDFNYTILDSTANVSGPSAGAAFTLLAISSLSGKVLLSNFTITGTISSNGSIGAIGGVYDKVSAAKSHGLSFVLVPAVPGDSQEEALYVLVQDTFGIPLVGVANISNAVGFAFGGGNILANEVKYQAYQNYNVSEMPPAPLSCSNGCEAGPFYGLVNSTFNLTNSSINVLASSGKFPSVVQQFRAALAQDRQLAAMGYLYTAADMSYLDYINAYFFDNYNTNVSAGTSVLGSVDNECSALSPVQLTTSNYDYVIGGELRQLWGEYTANSTLAAYNAASGNITTDDVLTAMSQAAQAAGWCSAASNLYSIGTSIGGQNVVPSQNLSKIASSRLSRALTASGPSVYTLTAQDAIKAQNYPLAIIDADYAYSINEGGRPPQNATTTQLLSMASSMASNSTFGVWATQFANEAEFNIWQARNARNASAALSYADTAYSTAFLAYQVSNDTRLIYQNLVPGTGQPQSVSLPTTTVAQQPAPSATVPAQGFAILQQEIQNIYILLFIVLIVVLIMLVVVISLVSTLTKILKMQNPNGIRPQPPQGQSAPRARRRGQGTNS